MFHNEKQYIDKVKNIFLATGDQLTNIASFYSNAYLGACCSIWIVIESVGIYVSSLL